MAGGASKRNARHRGSAQAKYAELHPVSGGAGAARRRPALFPARDRKFERELPRHRARDQRAIHAGLLSLGGNCAPRLALIARRIGSWSKCSSRLKADISRLVLRFRIAVGQALPSVLLVRDARGDINEEMLAAPAMELMYLKGVGPRRAEILAKRGLRTFEDLLGY